MVFIAQDLSEWFALAARLLANPDLPEALRHDIARKVCDAYLGALSQEERRLRRLLDLVAEAADLAEGPGGEGGARVHLLRFRSEYPDDSPQIDWEKLVQAALWWNDRGRGYSAARRAAKAANQPASKYELLEQAIEGTSFACDAKRLREMPRPPRFR